MKTVFTGLCLLCFVALHAQTLQTRQKLSMGTLAELSARESAVIQKGFDALDAVEHALSSYDENAEIYRLNKTLHVNISSLTYEALSLCKIYFEQSGGAFDITIGSVTRGAYRFGEAERLPTDAELQSQRVGFAALEFNATEARLPEGYWVDLGGMGKGFGVDKAYAAYRDANATEGMVALSGDIRCVGMCEISVQNPFGEGIVAHFKSLRPALAVSTSGNYRRYVKSPEYNHLIDPKTGKSEKVFASITLFSYGANADIDAWATAASVMPYDDALRFLDARGVGYVIYTVSGERILSKNLDTFVTAFESVE